VVPPSSDFDSDKTTVSRVNPQWANPASYRFERIREHPQRANPTVSLSNPDLGSVVGAGVGRELNPGPHRRACRLASVNARWSSVMPLQS
jgi:hypothetical protein